MIFILSLIIIFFHSILFSSENDKKDIGYFVEKIVLQDERFCFKTKFGEKNLSLKSEHLPLSFQNNLRDIEDIFKIIFEKKDLYTPSQAFNYSFEFKNGKINANSEYCNFKKTNRNEGFWTTVIEGEHFLYLKGIHEDSVSIEKTKSTYCSFLLKKNISRIIFDSCDSLFLNDIEINITHLCLANIHSQIQGSVLENFKKLISLTVFESFINKGNEFLVLSPTLKKLHFYRVRENSCNDKAVLVNLDPLCNIEKLNIVKSFVEINNQTTKLQKLQKIVIKDNDERSQFNFHEDSFNNLMHLVWNGNIPEKVLPIVISCLQKKLSFASFTTKSFFYNSLFNINPYLKKFYLYNQNESCVILPGNLLFQFDTFCCQNIKIKDFSDENFKNLKKLDIDRVLFDYQDQIIDIGKLSECEDIKITGNVLNRVQFNGEKIFDSRTNFAETTMRFLKKNDKHIYEVSYEKNIPSMLIKDGKKVNLNLENMGESSVLQSLIVTNVPRITIRGGVRNIHLDESIESLCLKENKLQNVTIFEQNQLKKLSLQESDLAIFIQNASNLKQLEWLEIEIEENDNIKDLEEKLKGCQNLKSIVIRSDKSISDIIIDVPRVTLYKSVKYCIGDTCDELILKGSGTSFVGGKNIKNLIVSQKNNCSFDDVDLENIVSIRLHCENILHQTPIWKKIIPNINKLESLIITGISEKNEDSVKNRVNELTPGQNCQITFQKICLKRTENNIKAKESIQVREVVKKIFFYSIPIIFIMFSYQFRNQIVKKFKSISFHV